MGEGKKKKAAADRWVSPAPSPPILHPETIIIARLQLQTLAVEEWAKKNAAPAPAWTPPLAANVEREEEAPTLLNRTLRGHPPPIPPIDNTGNCPPPPPHGLNNDRTEAATFLPPPGLRVLADAEQEEAPRRTTLYPRLLPWTVSELERAWEEGEEWKRLS